LGFSFLIGGIAIAIFSVGIPMFMRSPKNEPTIVWITGLSFALATLCLVIFFVAQGDYIQNQPPFFRSHALILGPLFYTSQYLQPLFLRSTRKKVFGYPLILFSLPLLFQYGLIALFLVKPKLFLEYTSAYSGGLFSLHLSIGFLLVIAWILYESTNILKESNRFLLRIIQAFSVVLVLHTIAIILFLIIDYLDNYTISNNLGGLSSIELSSRILRMGTFCIFEVLISIYWFQTYSSRAIHERLQHEKILLLLDEKDKLIENLANSSTLVETGALSAGLAHELNQFLARIEMNSDEALHRILDPNASAEDLKPFLENTLVANQSAAKLITSLRKLFHGNKEQASLNDLDALVKDTVSLYKARVHKSSITIDLNLKVTDQYFAWDSLFRQVISNLISNAIDALEMVAKPNRTISIESQIDQERNYCLTISDNGPGIRADKDQIFNLFETTKISGNGIGLWLSRYIIERHNGSIHYQNLPEQGGVAFTIIIPAAS
jgi:signal transduction histidine kinase